MAMSLLVQTVAERLFAITTNQNLPNFFIARAKGDYLGVKSQRFRKEVSDMRYSEHSMGRMGILYYLFMELSLSLTFYSRIRYINRMKG